MTPMTSRTPTVLLSVSWASPWANGLPLVRGAQVRLLVRAVDWQLSGRQRMCQSVRETWRTFRDARGCQGVVVSTTSVDAVLLGGLMRLRPRQRLAVYDFLLPRAPRARRIARWALRRVDVWLVIRRGDATTFRRELGARDCRFVPFPAHHPPRPAVAEADFVYAAGTAYRDWPTLVAAAAKFGIPTVISTPDVVTVPPDARSLVSVQPLNRPEEGHSVIARAAAVCVPLLDTEMPSGPLVVLDALVAGKAVVATDVNGTRDYIRPGVTGHLVPPGDSEALGRTLRFVLDHADRRREIGDRAREAAQGFAPGPILEQICREVLGARSDGRTRDQLPLSVDTTSVPGPS